MDRVARLLELLKKRYKQVAYIFTGALVLSILAFVVQTRIYKAEATIMPLKDSSSPLSALVNMVGSIPVSPNFLKGLGTSDVDRLTALLESETLAIRTIDALDLLPHLFKKRWDKKHSRWKKPDKKPTPKEAAKVFRKELLKIKESELGTIIIQIKFPDPNMAVKIADRLITELDKFINQSSFSVGRKNREFLETRLVEVKEELVAAEEEFKKFQEETGILLMDAQTEAAIELLAQLEAQKVVREIELGVLSKMASEEAPKVQLIKDELSELDKKIRELSEKPHNENNLLPAIKQSPELGLRYVRKKREFLIREKIFELITQQYELARIEENRELMAFQVVDPPIIPYEPSWPKLWINLGAALFAASVLSFVYLLLIDSLELGEPYGKRSADRDADDRAGTETYAH